MDSTGAVALSTTVGGSSGVYFALDAAGNAYVTLVTNKLYAVKNSLATCGFDPSVVPPGYAELLTVAAPDGSILRPPTSQAAIIWALRLLPRVRIQPYLLRLRPAPVSRPHKLVRFRRGPPAAFSCRASPLMPARRLTLWPVWAIRRAWQPARSRLERSSRCLETGSGLSRGYRRKPPRRPPTPPMRQMWK